MYRWICIHNNKIKKIVFKVFFILKYIKIIFFLFLKNYFLYQYIKIILKY